jgi:hypothetical protein
MLTLSRQGAVINLATICLRRERIARAIRNQSMERGKQ